MPPRSRCWFAARVLAVRREWILSMDRPEAEALEGRPYVIDFWERRLEFLAEHLSLEIDEDGAIVRSM